MSVYKKINKQTGEEVLRYIVYEGAGEEVGIDLDCYESGDMSIRSDYLRTYNYLWMVPRGDNLLYVMMHKLDGDGEPVMATHVPILHSLVLFDINDIEYNFDVKHTYTPEELEELYPSSEYDTVEIKND